MAIPKAKLARFYLFLIFVCFVLALWAMLTEHIVIAFSLGFVAVLLVRYARLG